MIQNIFQNRPGSSTPAIITSANVCAYVCQIASEEGNLVMCNYNKTPEAGEVQQPVRFLVRSSGKGSLSLFPRSLPTM
jgi:hypothetical protein